MRNGAEPLPSRTERLRIARMSQPAKELLRKARKAVRRDIWTQEGMDYADALARDLCRKLTKSAERD
jgi:hypothetical protein